MNKTWMRSNTIIWEEMDGGALLVSPSTGMRWSLNAAAARIWQLCDGARTFDDLARLVGVSRQHVADFCSAFGELGLLLPNMALTPAPISSGTAAFMSGLTPPAFRPMNLGTGPRRRPSPRGNSGPG